MLIRRFDFSTWTVIFQFRNAPARFDDRAGRISGYRSPIALDRQAADGTFGGCSLSEAPAALQISARRRRPQRHTWRGPVRIGGGDGEPGGEDDIVPSVKPHL